MQRESNVFHADFLKKEIPKKFGQKFKDCTDHCNVATVNNDNCVNQRQSKRLGGNLRMILFMYKKPK